MGRVMADFVLIHGAYVGGWCWRWVTPYLRAAGHSVYAPTLTGHGERVHLASPQVGLDTHIEDVVNLLHFEDLTGVILVGYSYGGMIAAGVADRVPERIGHLVHLDSDVPSDGDTSVPASRHAAREELAQLHGDGWRVPWNIDVDDVLQELPAEQRRWIAERLTPQLLSTWIQPIRLTGAGDSIPATYIRCTVGYDPTDEDTARHDFRIRSEPDWGYRELNEKHLAVLTAPRAVANVLLETL